MNADREPANSSWRPALFLLAVVAAAVIGAVLAEMAAAVAGVDLLTGAPTAPNTNVILPTTPLP